MLERKDPVRVSRYGPRDVQYKTAPKYPIGYRHAKLVQYLVLEVYVLYTKTNRDS